MRTTLKLDDDIYTSVLTLSRLSGDSVGKVVSQLVRQALSGGEAEVRAGFPTFLVPPGTPIIAGNRASDLLDEEP